MSAASRKVLFFGALLSDDGGLVLGVLEGWERMRWDEKAKKEWKRKRHFSGLLSQTQK